MQEYVVMEYGRVIEMQPHKSRCMGQGIELFYLINSTSQLSAHEGKESHGLGLVSEPYTPIDLHPNALTVRHAL